MRKIMLVAACACAVLLPVGPAQATGRHVCHGFQYRGVVVRNYIAYDVSCTKALPLVQRFYDLATPHSRDGFRVRGPWRAYLKARGGPLLRKGVLGVIKIHGPYYRPSPSSPGRTDSGGTGGSTGTSGGGVSPSPPPLPGGGGSGGASSGGGGGGGGGSGGSPCLTSCPPIADVALTLMQAYDANHDGVVTFDESWSARDLVLLLCHLSGAAYPLGIDSTVMQTFVSGYDNAPTDGFISPDEFLALENYITANSPPAPGGSAATVASVAAAFMAEADTNHRGHHGQRRETLRRGDQGCAVRRGAHSRAVIARRDRHERIHQLLRPGSRPVDQWRRVHADCDLHSQ